MVAATGRTRPHPAAAGARPRGRGVVAAAKRPAVLVPGDDRAALAAHPAGLEGCRVASSAARADRTPVTVAGAHHRGLAAAHTRLGVAALQTPDAQPPARGERGELPAGPAAPHAAGPRHTGDPRGVQLPQQPDKRQRPGRCPRGQRLGVGGQPGGELFAFTDPGRRSPERSGQHGGVRRAERGHKDLQRTLVGPGAAAGRAGADGAQPTVDLLGAAPLGGRGLAAGAHHPGWARVAQPPLLAARRAGRDGNTGRAGGHQRVGQVEQQPTARHPGRKQRPGRLQAAFQLDQRPGRRRDRGHHPDQRVTTDTDLEPAQDGDDAGQPLAVAVLLAGALAGTRLAGR